MSLLDTLRKNLSPEVFSAVQDALGDDFNYDVVPRSRLNKVINQRDEARRQLAQSGSQSGTGDDDDDGEGAGSGSNGSNKGKTGFTQADIDKALNDQKTQHDSAMADLRKQFAVTEKLRDANFVDPDLVLSAKLIDLSKVTTDASGAITSGLDDQIASLTQARPYLVNAGGGNGGRGTGKNGGTDEFGSVTSKEEFLKLSYEKQMAFKAANPEVFRGFLNQ